MDRNGFPFPEGAVFTVVEEGPHPRPEHSGRPAAAAVEYGYIVERYLDSPPRIVRVRRPSR